MLDDLRRDLVFAGRSLRRTPAFTIAAVLALGLAIGANTTVVSFLSALMTPFPVDDPERVTIVWSENPEQSITQNAWSVDDFLDLREQASSFEILSAGAGTSVNLTDQGEPRALQAWSLSSGFLRAFGQPVALGRGFEPADERPGAPPVVIVSHAFWRDELGGASEVLGETLRLDGRDHTVIGVTQPRFFFPDRRTNLYLPLRLEPGAAPRDARNLFVVGRLAPGADPNAAEAEMKALASRLAETWPATHEGWTARVQTMRENFAEDAQLVMALLYACITFVLLIACANVANLVLSRATMRERELAMRTSLGASRGRLVRQLLTESLLLAALGGIFGLALAFFGIDRMRDFIAPDPGIGFIAEALRIDTPVLVHALAVVVASALMLGLLPALQLSRTDLQATLKEGARGSGGPRRRWIRGALVTGEVALALALLGTAGGMIRAFQHLYNLDPGFEPRGVLTMNVTLPEYDYPSAGNQARFVQQALEELRAESGIEKATASQFLPLTLGPGFLSTRLAASGELERRDTAPNAFHMSVARDWVETFDAEMVAGRTFDQRDREAGEPVVLLSRSAAEMLWPTGDAVGRTIQLAGGGAPTERQRVVGVFEDVQLYGHSLRRLERIPPTVLFPISQQPQRTFFFALRSAGDPSALAETARDAIWRVDRRLPIDRVQTMPEVIRQRDTQNTFFVGLLSVLSLIALTLAAVGIYGVISYTVGQRRQEIGIRMALGAKPRQIVGLVVGQAATLTTLGLVVGLGLAFVMIRLLGSQLAGLGAAQATGPATFLAVALLLLLVAQIAGFVPARRAARVDPATTLREE